MPDSAFLQNAESVMFYALGDMNENRCIKMAIASAFELPGTNVDSLLTFHFNVASNIDTRIYSFKLQNILFEYDSNKHDNPSDVNVRIRVSKLGDANHDDKIRMDDATLLVNYILNKTSEVEYNAFLADMNDDGVIDIFDIMKLINAIVHGTQSVLDDNLSRAAAMTPRFEDLSLSFTRNGVTMGIPNAQRFTSFQFDIDVADDINLNAVKLMGTDTSHIIQFTKTGTHQYRVIGLSLDNSVLTGTETGIVALEIPNCGKIRVFNAMFVNPEGCASYFLDKEIENGISNVKDLTTIEDNSVYDLSGRKINNQNRHLHKGVYIINNKRVVIN